VVTKAENPAHPVPRDAILAAWAGATGAGLGVLTDLAQRARSGPPGWFAKWADIEARAGLIRWFEPLLIPGLGAVYTDPDLIARAARVFDGLRADALPCTQRQELLRKAGERWTL
jgi:hypothetical protein